MGFFGTYSAWLETVLRTYIYHNSHTVAEALTPAIVTCGTIYVMVWGYLQITGRVEEPFMAGVKRIAVLAIIFGCAINLWLYEEVMVSTFMEAPGALAAQIIRSYDSVTIVDEIINGGYQVAESLLQKAGWFDGNLSYYLAGGAVYVIVGLTAVYAIFLLSLSKIALAVLLALGPLFMGFLFFHTTRRFFEAWLAQLVNFALISILTVLVAALMLSLLKVSAEEAVRAGDGITISLAVRVCMTAALAFLIMRQVMPMASGLASGIALSSFNAVSAMLRGSVIGSAHSIQRNVGQFARGALMDEATTRWDSLSRMAGFYTKKGVKRLVSRDNTVSAR